MATAAGGVNLLFYSSCADSEPAVRMHQLINRLGVVYSQLVLSRTFSEHTVWGDGRLTMTLALEDHGADSCKSLGFKGVKILFKISNFAN